MHVEELSNSYAQKVTTNLQLVLFYSATSFIIYFPLKMSTFHQLCKDYQKTPTPCTTQALDPLHNSIRLEAHLW